MKKTIFLIVGMLIVLSGFVCAYDTTNLVSYFAMEDLNDYYGSDALINYGADNVPAFNNNGYEFVESETDEMITTDDFQNGYYTVCVWVKPKGSGMIWHVNPDEDRGLWWALTGSKFTCTQRNSIGGQNRIHSTSDAPANSWAFVCCEWNGADFNIYVDGSLENSMPLDTARDVSDPINFGSWKSNSYFADMVLDEVQIFNTGIGTSRIEELWNNGDGSFLYTHNVTLIYPPNRAVITNSIDLNYNISIEMDDCTLWINDSGTWNANQSTTGGLLNTTSHYFDINEFDFGSYIWNVQCFEGETEHWAWRNHSFILAPDTDGDDVADPVDNCPDDYNPNQNDTDSNGIGDACNDFEDPDNDDWADDLDNCPNDYNPNQEDSDLDGIGNTCDSITVSILSTTPENNSIVETPLVIFNYSVYLTNLSVLTNVTAQCRYSTSPGQLFNSMTLFEVTTFNETTTSLAHHSILDLPDNEYHYYIKCNDTEFGNVNDDYFLNFTIDYYPITINITTNVTNITTDITNITTNITDVGDIDGDGINDTVVNIGIAGTGANISNNILAFTQENILKYYDINTDILTDTGIDVGYYNSMAISGNIIALIIGDSYTDKRLEYYDINTETLTGTGIDAGYSTIAISNNIIALTTGSYSTRRLKYYDINTDTLTDTGIDVGYSTIAISNNIIAFTQGNILKYYDINTDTLTDTGIDIGPYRSMAISGNIIVLTTGSYSTKRLKYYDINTDILTDTEIDLSNSDIAISGNIVALTNGSYSDKRLKYYDINTGTLTDTGIDIGSSGVDISNNIITFSNPDISYLTLSKYAPHTPILDFIEDITVNEGETVTINATATDFDEDDLTYYINDSRFSPITETKPSGESFITTWDTVYGDRGTYVININVSDSNFSDEQNIIITVLCIDTDNDGVCDDEDQCIGENYSNLPENETCTKYILNPSGCHETIYKPNGFVVNETDCDYLDTPCKNYEDVNNTCDGEGNYVATTCDIFSVDNGSLICDSSYSVDYGCPFGTHLGSDIYIQTIVKYCGINTGLCDGRLEYLSDWQLFSNCTINESCEDNEPVCQPCPDNDSDNVCDEYDNCVYVPNKDQTDSDSDTIGDACDNCPNINNTDQTDLDTDSLGNVCDNCPGISNSNQLDSNADGIGDACTGTTVALNRSRTLRQGWNLLGYSLEDPLYWLNATVYNGIENKTIDEAQLAGWLQGTIYYFDEDTQYYKFVPGDDNYLRAWYGYWLYAFEDDLTLMIE